MHREKYLIKLYNIQIKEQETHILGAYEVIHSLDEIRKNHNIISDRKL